MPVGVSSVTPHQTPLPSLFSGDDFFLSSFFLLPAPPQHALRSLGLTLLSCLQIALGAVVGLTEFGIQSIATPHDAVPASSARRHEVVSSHRGDSDGGGQAVEGGRGVKGACLGSETSHGSRVHENEVGVAEGGASEIVTAVEGLDALTRIANMTPWLREHSLGAHVSLGLCPRLHANPATFAPAPPLGVGGGGNRLTDSWSPPGSPGEELTSTEMAATMLKREREALGAREHALECQRVRCLLLVQV